MATHNIDELIQLISDHYVQKRFYEAMEEVSRRCRCEEPIKLVRSRSRLEWKKELGDMYYRTLHANAKLAELDPWHLPSHFVMRKNSWSLSTLSGYWKEKEDEFIAIRSEGEEGSSSTRSPSYQGVRRTLEFYLKDGTKTNWLIHEYQQLDDHDKGSRPALFLREDVVARKVFQKQTNRVPSRFMEIDRLLDLFRPKQSMFDRQQDLLGSNSKHDWFASLMHNLHMSRRREMTPQIQKKLSCEFRELFMENLQGCEARSVPGERTTAPAANRGKSEVWQHFTKIYTKDPNVVYAACHCCDRVLNAHPRNGTSHLRRHTEKCSGNNNPSTSADREILRHLRATLDLYKQENMEGRVEPPELNTGLAQLDPWDLLQSTPCYITSSLSRETHHGRWKEIDKELTAIHIDQLPEPRYVGLKRTLEFHHQDGNKMDWIMLEYHQVDEYKPPNLLLNGGLVFRKVFQNYKDAVSYAFRELERMWDGDDKEDCYNGEHDEEVNTCMNSLLRDCLLGEDDQGDKSRPRKRKRTGGPDGKSEVWMHFTKVYTADPDRVYAVCHCCDMRYNGHSKIGTSHLRRHNEKCSSKHHEREAEVWPFVLIFEIIKEQGSGACAEAGNKEMA
ncbi:unnamed protein product [Urochloa humidicola]